MNEDRSGENTSLRAQIQVLRQQLHHQAAFIQAGTTTVAILISEHLICGRCRAVAERDLTRCSVCLQRSQPGFERMHRRGLHWKILVCGALRKAQLLCGDTAGTVVPKAEHRRRGGGHPPGKPWLQPLQNLNVQAHDNCMLLCLWWLEDATGSWLGVLSASQTQLLEALAANDALHLHLAEIEDEHCQLQRCDSEVLQRDMKSLHPSLSRFLKMCW